MEKADDWRGSDPVKAAARPLSSSPSSSADRLRGPSSPAAWCRIFSRWLVRPFWQCSAGRPLRSMDGCGNRLQESSSRGTPLSGPYLRGAERELEPKRPLLRFQYANTDRSHRSQPLASMFGFRNKPAASFPYVSAQSVRRKPHCGLYKRLIVRIS